MRSDKIRKMTQTALFTALTCAATMVIHIEMPATQGYLNLGDAFVLLGGWMLGPLYGAFAGGVGSALADLFQGYAHYVPGTLVIKGLMALVAALACRSDRHLRLRRVLGGLAAEGWMVLGYYLYALGFLSSAATALTSIPGNLLQGAVGLAAALALLTALGGQITKNQKVNTHG